MSSKRESVTAWEWVELELHAQQEEKEDDEKQLGVELSGPDGECYLVPGFRDGERGEGAIWKARLCPTAAGVWTWESRCTDPSDAGLHGRSGTVTAAPPGESAAQQDDHRHKGFVTVSESGRYFEYADGTPFYWLGDTFWLLYTDMVDIEHSLPAYLADRKRKGFTVIQVVAGRPGGAAAESIDDPPDDRWFSTSVGMPFHEGTQEINTDYFRVLDEKIRMIIDYGFVPCIFGTWAWDIKVGVNHLKQYWRELIARFSAMNVLWCVAGEYHFVDDLAAWRALGSYIDQTDPYGHPTSNHSTAPHSGSRHFQREEWYDFNLLQVGHVLGFMQLHASLALEDYHMEPVKPAIMSESWYENHPNREGAEYRRIGADDIRPASYLPLLNGCVGQSYGAHGIWTFHTSELDAAWDAYSRPDPWERDLELPGSYQMALLRGVFERVRWHLLEPHPELVTCSAGAVAHCACVPGEEYIVYVTKGGVDLFLFVPGGEGVHFIGTWIDVETGLETPAEPEYFPYGSWWRWTVQVPPGKDKALIVRNSTD